MTSIKTKGIMFAGLTLFASFLLVGCVSASHNCEKLASMSRLEERMDTMELNNRLTRLENRMTTLEREKECLVKEKKNWMPVDQGQEQDRGITNKEEGIISNQTHGIKSNQTQEIQSGSFQACQCSDSESLLKVTKTLEGLSEKLMRAISSLENGNDTGNVLNDTKTSDSQKDKPYYSPTVCKKNMTVSDDTYVLMDLDTVKGKIVCDTKTDKGGWIVFMRRKNGDEDFFRTWAEYREGFGHSTGDFWIGNEALHNLTSSADYEMRIDFTVNGRDLYARYSSFEISNEADKYRLQLGKYSGTVGQSSGSGMEYSRNAPFSTKDRDNNGYWQGNCAVVCHGAWWYTSCHRANLMGRWNSKEVVDQVRWSTGSQWLKPSFVEMKMRRL